MTAIISAWRETPEKEFEVYAPQIIDLNGSASSQIIMPVPTEVIWGGEDDGQFSLVIKEMIIAVTTTFAAGGTNNLLLGKASDTDLHHTYSTPNGTTAGTVLRVNQSEFAGDSRVLVDNATIQISCIGSLGSAGACRVGVRVSRRYDQWDGYIANRV